VCLFQAAEIQLESGGFLYPPALRLPDLRISLPQHGLAISAMPLIPLGLPGLTPPVEADLQPFIRVILFFLSDVLFGAVSDAVATAVSRESDLLANWCDMYIYII